MLKPFITVELPGEQRQSIAQALGTNETAVKVALHRWRTRYRELFRDEVARLVSSPEEIDDELRHFAQLVAS